jgi:hypothetical protein
MVKCPFCGFNNEDGTLFCEQCKSDLAQSTPVPGPAPTAPPGEAVPMAAVVAEATPAPVAESAPPMADVVPTPVAEEAPPAPAPESAPAKFPPDANPKLVVLRGQKINAEYPIYEGHNFIGRSDEKPVDIDLEDQEPPDRIWCSRQHALITFENGEMTLEDLNSSNGTFLNRNRVYPGQKKPLAVNDVIQIGNVQLKLKV